MKKKTKKYKPLMLLKLQEIINKAVENAGDVSQYAEVEFWFDENMIGLKSIGQFGIKPDVTIHLKNI